MSATTPSYTVEDLFDPISDSTEATGASAEELPEVAYNRANVEEQAKANLNFLAALAMPGVFTCLYPDILLAAWQLLTEKCELVRDFSKLALGIPRGHAKTTLMKLFILYCILFTNKRFILITAATGGMAENIVADVVDMLDEPNIVQVFGDWRLGIERDTNAVKKFGFRGRNIIIAALGAGGSLRGLNLKNERPDIMLFEDIQDAENAASPDQSRKLLVWMTGTAMKAKSPKGCLTIFVGNMFPDPGCILLKLKKAVDWVSFVVGGLLANGQALWEELQPREQLLAEFRADCELGVPEIFFAEVLNDPEAGKRSGIDLNKLPRNKFYADTMPQGKFITIDLATKKATADQVVINYHEVFDETPVSTHLIVGKFSPLEVIQEAVFLALDKGCPLICVETNGFQGADFWFRKVITELGIEGMHIVELKTGGIAKNSRINAWVREMFGGTYYLHDDVRAQVVYQLGNYNPAKTDNLDDILDTCAYARQAIIEHWHILTLPLSVEYMEIDRTMSDNTAPF